MNRFIAVILLVAILVGGFLFYRNYKKNQALTDGSYTCIGCLPPDKAAAYDRYDHGEGPDPEAKRTTSQRLDPNQTREEGLSAESGYVPAGQNQPAPPFNGQPSVQTINQPAPDSRPIVLPNPQSSPMASSSYGSDSLSPNPPNGMRFAGAGVYQWYREGNLTWRINTQTGSSCIIYATPDEWRKRIVLRHGCGNTL